MDIAVATEERQRNPRRRSWNRQMMHSQRQRDMPTSSRRNDSTEGNERDSVKAEMVCSLAGCRYGKTPLLKLKGKTKAHS